MVDNTEMTELTSLDLEPEFYRTIIETHNFVPQVHACFDLNVLLLLTGTIITQDGVEKKSEPCQ